MRTHQALLSKGNIVCQEKDGEDDLPALRVA